MVVLCAAAAPQPPAWTTRPDDLAPGMRTCLAGQGPAAFATEAVPDADGTVRVMLHAMGETILCILRDSRVVVRRALPGAAPPDPAAPAFFLERRCVDARRIDAPDGTILGWLAYPAC